MKRLLVTGSREWRDRACIEEALSPYADGSWVLVHGDCPSGADMMADQIWRRWQLPVERHPANWRLGKRAGYIRNQEMVDSGVDKCLAFRYAYSNGTTHCANAAIRAGVSVAWFTDGEDRDD